MELAGPEYGTRKNQIYGARKNEYGPSSQELNNELTKAEFGFQRCGKNRFNSLCHISGFGCRKRR